MRWDTRGAARSFGRLFDNLQLRKRCGYDDATFPQKSDHNHISTSNLLRLNDGDLHLVSHFVGPECERWEIQGCLDLGLTDSGREYRETIVNVL